MRRRSRDIDHEYWGAIEVAFDSLRHLSEEDQEKALAELFTSRPELVERVRGLLAAHRARPRDFLEVGVAAPDGVPTPSREIGGWRIVRRLGEGGHGEVFLATRPDDPTAPLGALKLLKGELGHASLVHLRREREMLSQLGDARCVGLLDAGVSAEGEPFLVTEHVEGLTLDQWIEARRPNLAALLLIAIDLCAAVASLHRHLAIHLDLKPRNIMVAADGRVKLLDFGIAQLTPQIRRSTALTPAYASPEQLEGGLATTQSDVFAVGAVLYEALVGALPGRTTAALSASEALERRGQPSPIKGVTPARLRGDLDAILDRCLRANPRERYSSIDLLADDLERFLAVRPVRARRGARLYRVGKALHRHWLGWTLATVALLALVGVDRLMVQKRAATRLERDRSWQAAGSFSTILSELELDHVNSVTPLTLAIARVDDLTEDPLVAARLHDLLGRTAAALGADEIAAARFERSWHLRRDEHGPGHGETLQALEAFASHLLEGLDPLRGQHLAKLLVAYRDRQQRRNWNGWARARLLLAGNLRAQERARGEALYHSILEAEPQLGEHGPYLAGRARVGLATLLVALGRSEEAEALLEPGLRTEPEDAEGAELQAETLLVLAAVAAQRHDPASAFVHIRKAVETRERWFGSSHPHTLRTVAIGVSIAERLVDEDAAHHWSREGYQRALGLPALHVGRRRAILDRVRVLRRHGEPSLARRVLENLPTAASELGDGLSALQLYEIGALALDESEASHAVTALERALEVLVRHPDADLRRLVERDLRRGSLLVRMNGRTGQE